MIDFRIDQTRDLVLNSNNTVAELEKVAQVIKISLGYWKGESVRSIPFGINYPAILGSKNSAQNKGIIITIFLNQIQQVESVVSAKLLSSSSENGSLDMEFEVQTVYGNLNLKYSV